MIGETNHLTSVKLGCCILCSYYRYHRSSGTERSRESKKYLPPYNFPHRRMMQIKPVRLKIYAFLETLRNVSLMLKTRRNRICSMYFYSNDILSFDKDRQH
ncbi:uncharacterized protein LOC102675852 isoform X2 [Apis dorsata]|uniref:uncharacterized protein LOC102675852 isoform X2 n=1 Tax=Apis dorsata TaxID=7462 RepID=UPI0003DF7F5D|nr:uncharacterized protein LOC102675852 isoform X2 [Apis dorsata]